MKLATAYRAGVQVRVGDTDFDGKVFSSIDVEMSENEPISWSMTISPDPDRDFDPWNTDATYKDIITPDIYSDEFTVKRAWVVSGQVGGTTFRFPDFILTNTQRSATASGFATTFTGMDFSRNLLIDNYSRDSFISTGNKIYTAREIIKEILADVKITGELIFDDYPVRQLHIQNTTPIDIINKLLAIPGAVWRFEGQKFKAYQPDGFGNVRDWTLKATQWTADKSILGLKNEVTVSRVDTSGAKEIIEGTENGIREHQLSVPKFNPSYRILQTMNGEIDTSEAGQPVGFLKKIRWKDEAGKYSDQGGYSGVAVAIAFVFRAIPEAAGSIYVDPNTGETTEFGADPNIPLYYKLEVTGTPLSMKGITKGTFEDAFSVTMKDEESQKTYGKLPASENIDDPLIPNEYWAKIYALRWLLLQKRNLDTFTAETVFNPFIYPGHTVYMPYLDRRYYVERVSHSIRADVATSRISASYYDTEGMEVWEKSWRG